VAYCDRHVDFNRESDQRASAALGSLNVTLAWQLNVVFVGCTGPHRCRPEDFKGRVKVNGRAQYTIIQWAWKLKVRF